MRPTCESEEDHGWEVVRWRRGLGGTPNRPVLRCTQCGGLRPATDFERAWMVRDVESPNHEHA